MRKGCILIVIVFAVLFAGCPEDPADEFPITVTVTDAPYGNGTVSVKGNLKKAAKGDKITLIGKPVQNYCVRSLTAIGGKTGTDIAVSGTGNQRAFTMPGEPVTVTAVFALEYYRVSLSGQYYNGQITGETGDPYSTPPAKAGETVTLLIIPVQGYYLSYIKAVGKKSGEEFPVSEVPGEPSKRTLIMPWEDVNIGGFLDGAEFLPIEP
jgi:hypothetical protein